MRIGLACLMLLAAAPAAGAQTLSQDGWGAYRIGMASGELPGPLFGQGLSEQPECDVRLVAGRPDVKLLVEGGVLVRITVSGVSDILTDRGVGVGSRESQVYAAYTRVRSDGGFVDDGAPWQELYAQPNGRGGRGLRFTLDGQGRVARIDAGGPAIEYRERCD
jgi:hypothetical protein